MFSPDSTHNTLRIWERTLWVLAVGLIATLSIPGGLRCQTLSPEVTGAKASPSPSSSGVRPITGTFYQPSDSCPLGNRQESWDRLFSEMKSLGMDTFILQWTVCNEVAFYDSDLSWIDRKSSDVLSLSFAMAEKYDFQIHIGLSFSDQWWGQKPGHLQEIAGRNREVIREIGSKYLPNAHFAGWYIPQEISNYTSTVKGLEEEIREFLKVTGRQCEEATPGALVSMAPFFNAADPAFSNASDYAKWWKRVASDTGLNLIMMQDGVGAHPVPMDRVQQYFIELRHELDGTGIDLWSDLEIFQFEGEEPNRALAPCAFRRVREQLIAESFLVSKIVCFAYPNYAFSALGPRQRDFNQSYRRFLEEFGIGNANR